MEKHATYRCLCTCTSALLLTLERPTHTPTHTHNTLYSSFESILPLTDPAPITSFIPSSLNLMSSNVSMRRPWLCLLPSPTYAFNHTKSWAPANANLTQQKYITAYCYLNLQLNKLSQKSTPPSRMPPFHTGNKPPTYSCYCTQLRACQKYMHVMGVFYICCHTSSKQPHAISHTLCELQGSAARRHSNIGNAIAFSPAALAKALQTAPVGIASYTVPQHATLRRIDFLRTLCKPSFPSLSLPPNSTVYSSYSLSLSLSLFLYATLPRVVFS